MMIERLLKKNMQMVRYGSIFFLFFICLVVVGCSGTALESLKKELNNSVAIDEKFQYREIATKLFNLTTVYKIQDKDEPLVVYIEGDGNAWINKYRLSINPTPKKPIGLHLAKLDPSANVLYIARPYQFSKIDRPLSEISQYWSEARYSQNVLNSINEAIEKMSSVLNNRGIHLVGFSGGGTLSLLLPNVNKNILSIRTVAGNLDPGEFTNFHKTSPLTKSLNPMSFIENIKNIPKIHYAGTLDHVVPIKLTKAAIKKFNNSSCNKLEEIGSVSHSNGWKDVWPDLVGKRPECDR